MNFTNDSFNQTTGRCYLLVGNVWMGLESAVLLCLAVMSQMSNILCFNILTHTSSGHVPNNVKILLCICNMAYFIRSFCLMIKALYNFCLIFFGFDYFNISAIQCIVVEYFYLAPVVAVYTSTLVVGLERLHKTVQKRATDNGKATWLRVACYVTCVSVFSTSVYAIFAVISQVTFQSTQTVCFCYSLLVFKKQATYAYTFGSISLNVASCVVYYFVYWQNRKILDTFGLTTAEHNLSDRFVKYANIKASRWLTPVTVFHAVFVVAVQSLAAIVKSMSSGDSNTVSYINFVTANLCLYTFEAYAHPLLCIKYSPVLINLARRMYPCLFYNPWISKFLFGKFAKVADSTEKVDEQKQENMKKVVEFRLNPQDNVDILADLWNKSKNELKNVKSYR